MIVEDLLNKIKDMNECAATIILTLGACGQSMTNAARSFSLSHKVPIFFFRFFHSSMNVSIKDRYLFKIMNAINHIDSFSSFNSINVSRYFSKHVKDTFSVNYSID